MKVEEENLVVDENSEFKLKTDLVIKALGFDPEDLTLLI